MEKRSSVDAVYAESLVFESNFGLAAVSITIPDHDVIKRARWIPAWSAAALVCESVGASETSRIIH